MTKTSGYVGRFAPSPTGDLHFGSLITAVASYLRARSQNGKWLLRIEDVDEKRNQKGSITSILRTLETHGFEWDDEILYQSKRSDIYRYYLNHISEKKLIYKCFCTRKKLTDGFKNPKTLEYVYSRSCLSQKNEINSSFSFRINALNTFNLNFKDEIQGNIWQNIEEEVGDFILWRNENFAAYQLAVVVDDELQGITEVFRGCDLLLQTSRQIYLQKVLNFNTPMYLHIPIALNSENQKLSKQTKATALDNLNPKENICKVLQFLGFENTLIFDLNKRSVNSSCLLKNAVNYFQLDLISKKNGIQFK